MSLQSQPRRNAAGRVHRSVDDRLRPQPTSDLHPHRRRRRECAGRSTPKPSRRGWHRRREALHGRYQETDTYTDGNRSAEVNFDIQTYCLRTGERCLSYWLNPDDAKILVFAQNQWALANTSADSKCKNGGRAHREITLQYPLPPPAQDPITLLTGRGHYTITGACPYNSDFDSRVAAHGELRF